MKYLRYISNLWKIVKIDNNQFQNIYINLIYNYLDFISN